jgi:hypothetical protein
VFAVVSEGTKREEIPEAVEAELGASAALNVTGEESLGYVWPRGRGGEKGGDAWKNEGAGVGELGGQRGDVVVKETSEVFFGDGKIVTGENLAQDVAIGAARVVDVV